MLPTIFPSLWGSLCPLIQAVVNAHDADATLTVALLTGREPDLNSDIKEKFVKLCEEHGIIRENIIDFTKTSKSGFIYFSHPEYFIIEETNPVGYQSFVEHWRVLFFLWWK
jgi:hypothetical protein